MDESADGWEAGIRRAKWYQWCGYKSQKNIGLYYFTEMLFVTMCCWADHEFKLGDTALLLTTAARSIHGRLFAKDNHYTCSLHLREAILQSLMIKVVFMQRICAVWAVITVSAASSFLFQQASLSSRESTSNTELERAINSADVVKAASPVDAFDDDPSLLGTAPAFKKFPTCQWLDDL